MVQKMIHKRRLGQVAGRAMDAEIKEEAWYIVATTDLKQKHDIVIANNFYKNDPDTVYGGYADEDDGDDKDDEDE